MFTHLGTTVLGVFQLPQGIIRWAGLVVLVVLGIGLIVPWLERLLER